LERIRAERYADAECFHPQNEEETMRSYYLLQYARVGQQENQRLQFSSFVIAASVVALGV